MFKISNTHHASSPIYMKKLKRLFGGFAGTQNYNDNGLDFTGANCTLIYQNINTLLNQAGPYTLEFYLEVNSTNKTSDRWLWCIGQVGSANNHVAFKLTGAKPQLIIYNTLSTTKTYTWAGSALAEGMHRVAVSFDPVDTTSVNYVVDGVASTVNGVAAGGGTGVITPQAANLILLGHNSYEAAAGTTYKFKGRVRQFQLTPFKRSAADMVRRQSDIGKLFPIDKYTSLDWDSRNYLKAFQKTVKASTKYIL